MLRALSAVAVWLLPTAVFAAGWDAIVLGGGATVEDAEMAIQRVAGAERSGAHR